MTQVDLDNAVEFTIYSCKIPIISPAKDSEQYAKLTEDLPEDADRPGEVLVACGTIRRAPLHEAMARRRAEAAMSETMRQLGGIFRDETKVDRKLVDVALCQQANACEKTNDTRFLRVQTDPLEASIHTVGELVILDSAAKPPVQASGAAMLLETTHQMSSLTEAIHNLILAFRTLASGDRLTRYQRIVRDIAANLGKEIRLKIEGGDAEIDQSVVEKISGSGDALRLLCALDNFQKERRIKFFVSPQQLGYH